MGRCTARASRGYSGSAWLRSFRLYYVACTDVGVSLVDARRGIWSRRRRGNNDHDVRNGQERQARCYARRKWMRNHSSIVNGCSSAPSIVTFSIFVACLPSPLSLSRCEPRFAFLVTRDCIVCSNILPMFSSRLPHSLFSPPSLAFPALTSLLPTSFTLSFLRVFISPRSASSPSLPSCVARARMSRGLMSRSGYTGVLWYVCALGKRGKWRGM